MTTHSPDHAERAAQQMLADRGRFPSGGDVPFDVTLSLIAAAPRGRDAVLGAEAVTDAIRALRCVSAHATEDADEIGQSITATEAAEALEQTWLRLQALWKEMAFPRDPVHGALMDDEMDRLLGTRAALHDAKEAGEQGCGEGRDG